MQANCYVLFHKVEEINNSIYARGGTYSLTNPVLALLVKKKVSKEQNTKYSAA